MKNTLLLIFAFLLSEFYNVAVSQDFAFYNINNLSAMLFLYLLYLNF